MEQLCSTKSLWLSEIVVHNRDLKAAFGERVTLPVYPDSSGGDSSRCLLALVEPRGTPRQLRCATTLPPAHPDN